MDYELGQAVTLYIENITNSLGVVVDPSDLELQLRHPDGTVDTHAIGALTHVAVGHYEFTFTPELPADAGAWWYRFEAENPDTANEGTFNVRRSVVVGGVAPAQPSGSTCSPWAEISDTCAPCNTYEFDPATLDDALQTASDVLFNLTGRRWPGECTETLRPCGYATPRLTPQLDARTGYRSAQWCGCNNSRSCGCRRPSEVRLPGYPVVAVQQVKIDGAIVPTARYRLDDSRWLVYLPEDGGERRGWPCCQRIDLPDTEDDTWSITYTFGTAPPTGGVRAAAILGCELALACSPETVGQCRLPKRVTSITRQGVTLAVLDPLSLFADGLTGIPEVDMWVASIRHGDARRPAAVYVPGATQHHRRVGR